MKRKLVSMILTASMAVTLLAGCGSTGGTADSESAVSSSKKGVKSVTLSAKDAALTGTTFADAEKDPSYDSDHKVIKGLYPGASASYKMPDGVDGTYDVYVQIDKSVYPYGQTPLDVTVNGAGLQVWPMQMEGMTGKKDKYDIGLFLGAAGVKLKSGDTVEVTGKYGFAFANAGVSLLPDIGDVILYPAGSKVAVGYDGGKVPEKQKKDASDPISGKTIVWLGSSVTYGMAAGGYSMADAIAENHAATTSYKYAISGTTLVTDQNKGNSSYVERLKEVPDAIKPDMLVVQLSTNDASAAKPLGTLSDSTEEGSFDTSTVTGAEEEILAYAKQRWNCPVVFYTGTYYENDTSANYQAMVDALPAVCDKWDASIVDLWNNQEMKAIYGTDEYNAYMSDGIHPNKKGYQEWWTPQFEEVFTEIFSKK